MSETARFFAAQISLLAVVLVLHTYIGLHIVRRTLIFSDLVLDQLAAFGALVGIGLAIRYGSPGSYLLSLAAVLIGALALAVLKPRNRVIPREAVIGILYAMALVGSLLLGDKLSGGSGLRHQDPGGFHAMGDLADRRGHGRGLRRSPGLPLRLPGAVHRAGRERQAPVEHRRRWDFLFFTTQGIITVLIVPVAGVLLAYAFLMIPAAIAAMFTRSWGARRAPGVERGHGSLRERSVSLLFPGPALRSHPDPLPGTRFLARRSGSASRFPRRRGAEAAMSEVLPDLRAVLGVPFLACVAMTGILGYLGLHVLEREIVFVDIAMAQIVAVGAIGRTSLFGAHDDSLLDHCERPRPGRRGRRLLRLHAAEGAPDLHGGRHRCLLRDRGRRRALPAGCGTGRPRARAAHAGGEHPVGDLDRSSDVRSRLRGGRDLLLSSAEAVREDLERLRCGDPGGNEGRRVGLPLLHADRHRDHLRRPDRWRGRRLLPS